MDLEEPTPCHKCGHNTSVSYMNINCHKHPNMIKSKHPVITCTNCGSHGILRSITSGESMCQGCRIEENPFYVSPKELCRNCQIELIPSSESESCPKHPLVSIKEYKIMKCPSCMYVSYSNHGMMYKQCYQCQMESRTPIHQFGKYIPNTNPFRLQNKRPKSPLSKSYSPPPFDPLKKNGLKEKKDFDDIF